jgi:predicted HNH restriction endonuclease
MHHIIFRNKVQCGTDDPLNLAPLCQRCHFAIHHGTDTELRKAVSEVCYKQVREDLSKCWKAKIKPKIINILERP